MFTTGEILISALLFIGGVGVTIIGYFLSKTMEDLTKVQELANKTKGELDVLSNDHNLKDKFLNDKFERLNSSLDKLTDKIEELTAKIK